MRATVTSLGFFLAALFAHSSLGLAQTLTVQRVEPSFWWTDMPTESLQVLLYGENVGHARASIDTPGVDIIKQISVDSPNYLFLYLDIHADAKPGIFEIQLAGPTSDLSLSYELKQREPTAGRNMGFDASDLVYLMMPDRFANGDPSNDNIEGLTETVDRSDPTKRQGGDIQGISDHLDYIKDLGMTAIWVTPIFENNSPPSYGGYHGYAATDLYQVDRRLGSNRSYKNLIQNAHQKGMKVIMDMIHNHIGLDHWWMQDLPTKDWVHDVEKVGYTNFKGTIPGDPHASEYDKTRLVDGWFVPYMPDLNQHNPLLADYLIQNSIWWIEYSGIDGIRMDTYLYPDPEYMARWVDEVLDAYPNFNIVGEVWTETVYHEAYWQKDLPYENDGYDSRLPTVTDFPLCFAIRNGLNEDFGWETGISRLYYTLAQDALYSDPYHNVIFLDNHDMGRIYEQLGKNENRFKIAYTLLLTLRGIPVVYYGTELMMEHENRGGDDEAWRQTMPGGWPGDPRSVFESSGRTEKENEIIDFVSTLNKWRNETSALHHGKLLHFVPENNVYVFFRHTPSQAVMTVVNLNVEPTSLDTSRFQEILSRYPSARYAISRANCSLEGSLELDPESITLIELTNQ